jgi:hypothetical protein
MASTKKTDTIPFIFPKFPAGLEMPHVGPLFEAQRRNAQAMAEAMQCSMRGLQKAMMRQTEILTRVVQDNTRIGETLTAETPERRMQSQADLMGHVYRASVEGAREVRTILAETEREMSEIVGSRMSESLKELQTVFAPAEPQAKA